MILDFSYLLSQPPGFTIHITLFFLSRFCYDLCNCEIGVDPTNIQILVFQPSYCTADVRLLASIVYITHTRVHALLLTPQPSGKDVNYSELFSATSVAHS